MIKIKNNKKIIYIGIAIIAIILVFGYFYKTNNNPVPPIANQASYPYTSKLMKFTVLLPSNDLQLSEGVNALFIKNNVGEIRLTRQGTNYDSLDNYLNSLDLKIVDKENLIINDNSVIRGSIESRSYYFIYINNWVYALSTSSPELYSDLDQIARSFRYTP